MGRGANVVRIIGGEHRGRRLQFVAVRGLRPTPDRVRETLFNWLRNDIHGAHCLDLYAGSGALGFEALSRGAASVTAVEHNALAARQLRENARLMRLSDRLEVRQSDALQLLGAGPDRTFDIVFVDPPFAERSVERVCATLDRLDWLAPHALVYIEQDAHCEWPSCPVGWESIREGRAGQSAQRLLRCST